MRYFACCRTIRWLGANWGSSTLSKANWFRRIRCSSKPRNCSPRIRSFSSSSAKPLSGLANCRRRETSLTQVLDKKPGDETALLLLVDTAVTPDEIKQTQKLIESLREKDQDRASYHLVLGILDLRQKNDVRAESRFKASLELDPKSSGAYSALGRLYWSRHDLKAADEAMKTAADLSPLRSPMQLRYVDFKLRYGAFAEAKAILEGINNKFPDYLPPRVYLMTNGLCRASG